MLNEDAPYRFTIFIPTYNRADLLPRAFESVEQQTFRDFEVVIIDDGSTDNSREVVEAWAAKVDFPVRYHYQKNQGKAAAHNAANELAQGFFVVNLDSDDLLATNALERFDYHWRNIPDEQKPHFAGVEGLCELYGQGKIAGDRFPKDVFDSNYMEIKLKFGIGGDKKNAIRADVLREFPYPLIPGERHIRQSQVWNRIATKYQFRYINEVVEYIEYQPDGLSISGAYWRRLRNPKGNRLVFQELVNDYHKWYSPFDRFRNMAKYVRFSMHCGVGLSEQRTDINNRALWWLALPKGYINYKLDLRKLKRRRAA